MSFYKEVPGRKTTLESTLKFDTVPTEGSTNPVTSDGVASGISQSMRDFEEVMYADQEIPESTLRFSFGDLNYDPTQDTAVASRHNIDDRAGGGTPAGYGGTWKKLRTKYTNIWDYTYVDDTLLNEFDNGNWLLSTADTETRFWNDVEHNPIKIIASNTAGCESFKRAFQGCLAITEIWELDTSDSTNMMIAFSYCKNLVKVPQMNMSSCTNFNAIFQDCHKLESIPAPVFPDDDSPSYQAQLLFYNCLKLKSVDGILNFKSITNVQQLCFNCPSLESITMENTGRVTTFGNAFAGCLKLPLKFFDSLDTSGATYIGKICGGHVEIREGSSGPYYFNYDVLMKNITRMPNFNISNVTNANGAFRSCNIESIDTTALSALSGSVKVDNMFRDCVNCKSGILDAYAILDAVDSNHTDCFKNCGIDTPTGRAELEQIPASWGGLAES